MRSARFATTAWSLLGYTVLVILWGAFVRASGSGDGCGNHWPDCGGSLIPTQVEHTKTWIEFAHRFSTGLMFPFVIGVLIYAFRVFQKGSPVRKAAIASLIFTLSEALIGAVLVKKGLVAYDDSANRAIVMSFHLVNTLFLLTSMALTAIWASGVTPAKWRTQGTVGWCYVVAVASTLLLAVSGAISALGDTLFKAESVAAAMQRDFSPTAHFLERLRPLHPLLAVSVGLYLILISGVVGHLRPSQRVHVAHRWLVGVFCAQIVLGLVNLAMNAPIWMQIVHLLVADATWVCLIVCAAIATSEEVPRLETSQPMDPLAEGESRTFKQSVGEYISLTKPRVISLLLFTTLTALCAAAGGWPGIGLFSAVAVGGYMAAGAANAINMVIDRDIDATMKRTASRPTVTRHISASQALVFAFLLAAGSFGLLWAAANLLTAVLALAGLAFYVVVYTLLLKRRTWHNIVIGGAAGAFPPLVGWAAATNELGPIAWYLFAIIFLWTPVHFWALSLLIKDDYANAGVPMLPVVHGDRATSIQIVLYAILTVIVSTLPFWQPTIGWTYLAVATALNLVLLIRALQLYFNPDRPHAVTLYKYSMLYLAVLFLTLAIDRTIGT